MTENNGAYYRALVSHDPRFDGIFFVGVTSTHIYCRPVCTAKTPKAANCRFFGSAEAAEKAGFRPCLRCRPELAPGTAPIDDAQRIARLLVHRLEEGMAEDESGLEAIASSFELSSRQIRRIVQREMGVSPMELISTRRLLLAKQLLTETALPVTEVAFASGFASLRRFNDAFLNRYGLAPSRFRKKAVVEDPNAISINSLTLQLSYRPPFDWPSLRNFLADRRLKGVESLDGESYLRTVAIGGHKGWVGVRDAPAKRAILVQFDLSLLPVLPALLRRLRHAFDLDARPDRILTQLRRDSKLAPLLRRHPGLRIPGAFDGFELAMRAILGQQITVKAATTLAGRLVEAFGQTLKTPYRELNRTSPGPERIAALKVEDLAELGIIRSRARGMIALAEEVASGRLKLESGALPDSTIERLVAIPGVGKWTAQYIAMRALGWPDAFPKEDVALRNKLGGISAVEAEKFSQAWRPWRSYATAHLWKA